MVIYFSGTGNSRYVAEKIAEGTDDVLVSMNRLLKKRSKEEIKSENHPFVFVGPTYAWRLPRVVEEFIRDNKFAGSKKAYFILTCGADTSNAVSYVRNLCQEKGWDLQGFAEIVMPDNYIALYEPSDEESAKGIIQKAEPVIQRIVEDIRDGSVMPAFSTNGLSGKLKSGVVNEVFYRMFVDAKGFYATDKCIGCGKCVKLCPLNNVEMDGSRPAWGKRCTHCMACICGCPHEAIEYKNKTQGRRRYYLQDTYVERK